MPQNLRKAMTDYERLKTLSFQRQMARRASQRANDRIFYLSAVIWAALAALPSIVVARPLPYMLGSTAANSIYGRVDYKWRDAAAETQALRNLESGFARRYKEKPLQQWATETHGPIDRLLIQAAAANSARELADMAKDLAIPLTPAQAEILWRGAAVAKNDPFHYLVTPFKEVLDNEVFPRGILAEDRYETESGRTIRIVRDGSTATVMVGGERGPTTRPQLDGILERRFRTRLSTWLPDDFKNTLREIVLARIQPSQEYDEAASNAERDELREELLTRVQNIKKNDLLIARGESISFDKLAKLREEDRVYREAQGWRLPFTRFIGNLFLFAAISMSMVSYFRSVERSRPGVVKRFLAVSVLCLVPIFVGYWLIYAGLPGTVLPIGLIIGIIAFGAATRTALFLVALTSVCGLILYEGRPDLMAGYLTAGLFFVVTAPRCRRRSVLLMVSFFSGLIGAASFITWNLARGDMQNIISFVTSPWSLALAESRAPLLAALGLLVNWVLCGIAVLLLMPLVERFFGVTTRIRLQDLSGYEHPLLKRLILEAPGTYHHSSIVSSLAEAGADAIGADGLKARIGGMFHDIGKLYKPEYFTENEAGMSRHKNMSPNMSALLIINHVRDGSELARSFRLPSLVVDIILQHHGNSLMRFFHHKAQTQAPEGTLVPKMPFLYPGPRPQTPEAGVVMIADAVEAAIRSLDTPSPQHLRELLARLIRERLIDRQFEESGISMSQLAQIGEVMFRMLTSMYHTRVKYPDQEKPGAKGKKR